MKAVIFPLSFSLPLESAPWREESRENLFPYCFFSGYRMSPDISKNVGGSAMSAVSMSYPLFCANTSRPPEVGGQQRHKLSVPHLKPCLFNSPRAGCPARASSVWGIGTIRGEGGSVSGLRWGKMGMEKGCEGIRGLREMCSRGRRLLCTDKLFRDPQHRLGFLLLLHRCQRQQSF